jgi:hypothetical protein
MATASPHGIPIQNTRHDTLAMVLGGQPLNGTSEQFAIVVATICAHYFSSKLNLKNHWSTPPMLVSESIKATGAATE